MKRILSIISAAFMGATVGYVAHQVMQRQPGPEGAPIEVIVGAPPFTALLAAVIGLVFGRSRAAAFLAGAAITGSVGDRLDRSMPAIATVKERLAELKQQGEPT